MKQLRVGVIGAGQAGGRHVGAFTQLPGVRVVAVVDPDERRGTALADSANARYLPETTQRFWDDVDAVGICVPHALLFAEAMTAIGQGKHLLLEKPMALSLVEIDTIVTAAAEAGVTLMVGFVHRFRAESAEAKRHILRGAIGRPVFAVEHMIQGVGSRPGWVWQQEMGGGVLLYSGVHALDRLRWLLDSEVTAVYAHTETVQRDADVEDTIIAMLTYANGVRASCIVHIAQYPLPASWRSEMYGTDGAITIAPDATLTVHEAARTLTFQAKRDDRFLGEVHEFVRAIDERRAPAVTGADGRAALATALAIHLSARTGHPVSL